jgi:hypothetical protein
MGSEARLIEAAQVNTLPPLVCKWPFVLVKVTQQGQCLEEGKDCRLGEYRPIDRENPAGPWYREFDCQDICIIRAPSQTKWVCQELAQLQGINMVSTELVPFISHM